MLRLSLKPFDGWDDIHEEFVPISPGAEVELEHSLYTVSLWEADHKIPFAKKDGLDRAELLDYVKNYMCQTKDVPPEAWLSITNQDIEKIAAYLKDDACATKVYVHGDDGRPGRKETVTAELLYFYMAQFNIPFECEHWHFNRLMKMLNVAAIKSSPPKKMGKRASAQYQKGLNAKRRSGRG